jgi:hypothetical protein
MCPGTARRYAAPIDGLPYPANECRPDSVDRQALEERTVSRIVTQDNQLLIVTRPGNAKTCLNGSSCMGGAESCRSLVYLLAEDKDAGRNMGYIRTATLINS